MVTWFYRRGRQNINAVVLMLSLGVARCAGRIGQTHRTTHQIYACAMGSCGVFEARRFSGAGDLRFTMNVVHTESLSGCLSRWDS